jgi:aconitase A
MTRNTMDKICDAIDAIWDVVDIDMYADHDRMVDCLVDEAWTEEDAERIKLNFRMQRD